MNNMWDICDIYYKGSHNFAAAYQGDVLQWERPLPLPNSNQIIYTSTDGHIVEPTGLFFDSNNIAIGITSNIYYCNYGIITFERDLDHMGNEYQSAGSFRGCTTLKSLVIPESVGSCGGYIFEDCTSLQKVKFLHSPFSIICPYLFHNCKSITSLDDITFGDGSYILSGPGYGHTYEGCTGLKYINLGGVTVAPWEFARTGLEMISMNGIRCTLQEYCFAYCSNLQTVSIFMQRNDLSHSDDYSFYNVRKNGEYYGNVTDPIRNTKYNLGYYNWRH